MVIDEGYTENYGRERVDESFLSNHWYAKSSVRPDDKRIISGKETGISRIYTTK